MPGGRYRFVRNTNSIEGLASVNRSSTDALNTVNLWSNAAPQRSFAIIIDEDEQLLVDLSWSDTDISAGPNLDDICHKFGVERSYVKT